MDESKMTVLTQEEFDYIMSEHGFPIIENRVIDGLVYDRMDECCTIKFKNCIIKSLKMHMAQVNTVFLMCNINHIDIWVGDSVFSKVALVKSVINDYRNVKYRYKAFSINKVFRINPVIFDCTFTNPLPSACPEEGSFIGWKKCVYGCDCYHVCIVKLLIPEDAKRSSGFGKKCRCEKAIVLDILDANGDTLSDVDTAYSAYHSGKTKYIRGQMVKADAFDNNRFNECSHGIHFFMSIEEAANY